MKKIVIKIISILFIMNVLTNTAQADDHLVDRGAYLVAYSMDKMIEDKAMTYSEFGLIVDNIEIINLDNIRFLSAACIIETKEEGICRMTINTLIKASREKYPNHYLCNLRDYISEDANTDIRCKSI
tara:strand:+ start:538 stop:918 length:381 start_codon:yes stop_codon:yes gene_type:complete